MGFTNVIRFHNTEFPGRSRMGLDVQRCWCPPPPVSSPFSSISRAKTIDERKRAYAEEMMKYSIFLLAADVKNNSLVPQDPNLIKAPRIA